MRLSRIPERFVGVAGEASVVLLCLFAPAQVALLVARKLGQPTVAAQEMLMAFAVPAVLFAVPFALIAGRHVRVDALDWPGTRRLGALFAFALGAALVWWGGPYAWASYLAGEGSYEASGFAWRWAAKASLPAFGVLLALAAAVSLLRRA